MALTQLYLHLRNYFILASLAALLLWCCKAQAQVAQSSKSSSAKRPSTVKPVHKPSGNFLIPPPPPLVPPDSISLSGNGIGQVEFMSVSQLKTQKENLGKLVEQASRVASDRKANLSAARDRATQFESLYKEGVVSKKEMESAAADVTPAQQSADEATNDLNQLQSQLAQINSRLIHSASKNIHTAKKSTL